MSLFFYILKGDSNMDGAHATILKSHRKKKISMLFRPSTTISEAELISYYGPGQVVIATGEPGDGFAEAQHLPPRYAADFQRASCAASPL